MNDIILTGRERALLSRDYSLDDILRFSRMPRREIEKAALHLTADLTADATPTRAPSCIFVGAQPGSGKSTYIRKIKESNTGFRYVELTMDDYRSFHPLYAELEDRIERHWIGRTENDLDSPGSDIADFTQLFAGDVVDRIEELVSGESGGPKYSILYEWAMRASVEPLNAMRRLSARGYRIEVCFIAVNRRISLEACRQRSRIMNSKGRLFRTIPDSFHRSSVERLPEAINDIYRTGYELERLIDTFVLIDRKGTVLWRNGDATLPGDVFRDILENGPLDVENSSAYAEVALARESRGLPASE